MINEYDQMCLGAEPRATLLSTGTRYKEISKKAKKKNKIMKKEVLWPLTKLDKTID